MSPNPRNRTADTDRNSIELDDALEQEIRKLSNSAAGNRPGLWRKFPERRRFGSMAAVAPERSVDRLIQLAADRPRLDALRRTAYETTLTRSLDMDTICDRYARLIGEMLHELLTGAYSTPAPVFVHPAFGGRSLPPALQFDPDRIDRGASLEDR
jgi:hypothetical protein